MFDVQTTLLGLTAAINIGLFVFVLLGNPRSPIHRSFALFTLCLSVWAALHIGFRLIASDVVAAELLKLSYVCALLIAASFYHFSIVFPEGQLPRKFGLIALVVVTLLGSAALLLPHSLIEGILHKPYGRAIVLRATDYIGFAMLFCALFLGGQVRLWRKYQDARGTSKAQVFTIATSVTVIGFFGIFFDLILPSPFFGDFQFIWSGPVLTFIFAIVTTYSIFRYHLFELKPAVVEVLVFAWWVLTLVRALSGSPSLNFIADQVLLMISVPIGTLLLQALHLKQHRYEEDDK